jgi:hypothetical protein
MVSTCLPLLDQLNLDIRQVNSLRQNSGISENSMIIL